MAKTIGIDLGTTNCCVYCVEGGVPTLIPNREGQRTTPSMVAFTAAGKRLVGIAAERQAVTNPARTVFGTKRLIGRKLDSPEVAFLQTTYPFEIIGADNGDAWIRLADEVYSPPEIAAYILSYLKEIAEEYLGEPVVDAVVTVPAFFDDRQRQATKDAGTLAGLTICRILNEPTAAALAYGFGREGEARRLAVFDLGGGTFDISILEVTDGVFEVLSNAGDTFLGGDDFDRQLIDLLLADFRDRTGVDLTGEPMAMQRLKEAAKGAKHDLTLRQSTEVNLPFIVSQGSEPLHLHYPNLTREHFESLVEVELDGLIGPCEQALTDAGLTPEDLDQVVLVGGMTRMPAVQRVAEQIFAKPPARDVDPDEVVAMGAALQGSIITGELREVVLLDVTPHSLGLRVAGGRFSRVIERNTRIPCRQKKLFAPIQAAQDFIMLEVYQGESDLVQDNVYLGRFTLESLPPQTQVEVSFGLDADGLLRVSAVEMQTGRQASIDIRPSGGLSPAQLDALIERRHQPQKPVAAPQISLVPGTKGPVIGEQWEPEMITIGVPEPQVEAPRASGGPDGQPPLAFSRPDHRAAAKPELRLASAGSGSGGGKPELLLASEAPALQAAPEPEAEPPPPPSRDLIGLTLGNRYVIDELLGRGGMARVYLAHHRVLNKKLAIKVLSPGMASDRVQAKRFLAEANAASAIASDHVVDISDFGELEDGSAYFVMEYLDGITLAELLAERGALPEELVYDLGLQLAEGMAAAHAQQIIHRDLKPENVCLVTRGAKEHFCKIFDFGIAKSGAESPISARPGLILGTPSYMSPEQVEGTEIDHRTDIYSLGVVLYELVAGHKPFDSDNVTGLLVQHKYTDPPSIADRSGQRCSPHLEGVIRRCLQKDPDQRYQSMDELAGDLRR